MADMLSEQDVRRLLSDPSADHRAETASKVARQFEGDDLSVAERALAEDIFRIMMKDAEVRVREALAENLKENPHVPHDVAVTLAGDVDTVALPILEFSEVLNSEDLIAIVSSQGAGKQTAVARRKSVDEAVSEALVDHGNEIVVSTLVANQGAEISDKSLTKVVDKYGDSEAVQAPLIQRPRLPVTVTERLVTRVSEHLKAQLVARHDLPADLAADLIMQSREKATIDLSTESTEDEVQSLVRQLNQNNRLTPSIILRALCMGDTKFFEYAMAERAGIPVVNARILIHDSGDLGLKGLYEKCGQPSAFFPAVKAAVAVSHETDYDGEAHDRERYRRRILERILTQYGDLGVDLEGDDLEYLLTKMQDLRSSAPPEPQ